jgi:hypothetical protein
MCRKVARTCSASAPSQPPTLFGELLDLAWHPHIERLSINVSIFVGIKSCFKSGFPYPPFTPCVFT